MAIATVADVVARKLWSLALVARTRHVPAEVALNIVWTTRHPFAVPPTTTKRSWPVPLPPCVLSKIVELIDPYVGFTCNAACRPRTTVKSAGEEVTDRWLRSAALVALISHTPVLLALSDAPLT